MPLSPLEIVIAIFGSGGIVTLIVAMVAGIGKLLKERTARAADRERQKLIDSIEIKRLDAEVSEKKEETLIENLWKLIKEAKAECDDLKTQLEKCEEADGIDSDIWKGKVKNLRKQLRELEDTNDELVRNLKKQGVSNDERMDTAKAIFKAEKERIREFVMQTIIVAKALQDSAHKHPECKDLYRELIRISEMLFWVKNHLEKE